MTDTTMADFVHVEVPQEKTATAELNLSGSNSGAQTLETSGLGFLKLHPFIRDTVVDKIYGCMIGSALGDTIGLYTEFLPKHACETIYKERKFTLVNPVTEWYSDTHRNRFEPCAWTDDTDQALLILLSYLQNHTSENLLGRIPQDFAERLQIWIEQGLRALDRPPCGIGALVGGVVSHKDYLKDPVDMATQRWIKTARHVAPNGSLMRTHPIGVFCVGLSEEAAWKVAADIGRTTHVDPRCVVSCCISVGLIRGLLRGEIQTEEDLDKAIERAYDWVLSQPGLMNPGLDSELTEYEIKRHLERKEFEKHVYAKAYEELKLDSQREMGYVYKCIGSAILMLRYGIRGLKKSPVPSKTLFENLVTDLIMEGGDSDTNGAAAGALLGALMGYGNLPAHWADGLAHREWLQSKIERLTKILGIVQGSVGELKDEAPDGGKPLMTKDELEKRDHDMLYSILARDKERKEKEERERKKGHAKGLTGWFKK
ncbi:ADP-ribosylglycohydrolase [Amniculicola lignicola CBS 123094]|uniref:ADP-ribosylglycohydrolase n=1 Tax=Amniculicola lignicola CBS 123094 TaxID=1392246 RepID=A0A6A5VU74_9PLEO|nr:ADP-ribosylglycohydrolase [Amniculicola lignicola CBS 123094]